MQELEKLLEKVVSLNGGCDEVGTFLAHIDFMAELKAVFEPLVNDRKMYHSTICDVLVSLIGAGVGERTNKRNYKFQVGDMDELTTRISDMMMNMVTKFCGNNNQMEYSPIMIRLSEAMSNHYQA